MGRFLITLSGGEGAVSPFIPSAQGRKMSVEHPTTFKSEEEIKTVPERQKLRELLATDPPAGNAPASPAGERKGPQTVAPSSAEGNTRAIMEAGVTVAMVCNCTFSSYMV